VELICAARLAGLQVTAQATGPRLALGPGSHKRTLNGRNWPP